MEQTFKIGKATVTVIRPELTPEERERRENELKEFLKYYNENKYKK